VSTNHANPMDTTGGKFKLAWASFLFSLSLARAFRRRLPSSGHDSSLKRPRRPRRLLLTLNYVNFILTFLLIRLVILGCFS
jgi:hypothetical protein